MRKIVLIFCLVVTLGFVESNAQTKTFTLDEAIETAIVNNPETRQAAMDIKKADAAVDQAWGNAMPRVDVSANYYHYIKKPKMAFPDFEALLTQATYGILEAEGLVDQNPFAGQGVPTILQSFVQSNNYEAKAELSQIIFNSAVFEGIGAAGVYKETSEQSLRAKVVATIADVKKAFYGALIAEEAYEITKTSFDNAQENLENVTAMYEQGLVADYDRMQAEVRVENIRPQLLEMENVKRTALDGLKISLGIDPREEIALEGELDYVNEEVPAAGTTIEEALSNNGDLATLRLKKQLDEALVQVEKAAYYPSLVGFGNYSFAGSADDMKFQNYQSGMVGLSASINVFNGFQTSNKVQQAEITKDQTQEQIDFLKDFIAMQIRMKINELERVKSLMEAQERNVNLAQRTYEIAQVMYREGTGTQLEVQNADVALAQARTNRLNVVQQYLTAQADLEKLVGAVDQRYVNLVRNEFNVPR